MANLAGITLKWINQNDIIIDNEIQIILKWKTTAAKTKLFLFKMKQ